MVRSIVAVFAGLFAWILSATLCGLVLRASWPAYTAAEPSFAFTIPMLLTRLAIGALATLNCGALIARVAPGRRPALGGGIALLAVFIPLHIAWFNRFPVWYHAIFLISLVPLTMFGARLARSERSRR